MAEAKVIDSVKIDNTKTVGGVQVLSALSDGSLKTKTIFTKRAVTIEVNKESVEIGELEEYHTYQNISADKAKTLLVFLKEQASVQKALLAPQQEYIDANINIDAEGEMAKLLNELQISKKTFHKFPKLERYAEIATSKADAVKAITGYGNIVEVVQEQINFLEKYFG